MPQLRLFQTLAKAGADAAFSFLILPISLYCGEAFAQLQPKDSGSPPPTQTDPVMAKTPPDSEPPRGATFGARTTPTNQQPYTNMSDEVLERLKANGGTPEMNYADGQYIFGRGEEARILDEKLINSLSGTVAVQSEAGGGRRGIIDELIRQNPGDTFYRLNMDYFRNLSEADAPEKLKEVFNKLAEENIAAGAVKRRVILVIENFTALQSGSLLQPINVLWEKIAYRTKLYTILVGSPKEVKATIIKNKRPEIPELVNVHETLPPEFDMVIGRLLRNKSALETTAALQEAARISVRYQRGQAFRFSRQLLDAAARMVSDDQRTGFLTKDRLLAEVKQLKLHQSGLQADLNSETEPKEIDRLNREIQRIQTDVDAKEADIRALKAQPDSRAKQARLEYDIAALQLELEDTRKNSGIIKSLADRFGGGKHPQPAARNAAEISAELAVKNAELTEVKIANIDEAAQAQGKPAKRVGERQVVAIAARWLKVSPERLSANFDEGIRRIDDLNKVVFGQRDAIETIGGHLKVQATKLNDGPELTPEQAQKVKRGLAPYSERPTSFFFGGASGVGKTLTAEELAKLIDYHLSYWDMTNYKEAHSISSMIGSRPGYVGSDEMGALLREIKENPKSVLVFDEIEKAHPEIAEALMQALDKGYMKDPVSGEAIDFRQCVMIFTSNLAQDVSKMNQTQLTEFLRSKGWSDVDITQRTDGKLSKLRSEVYKLHIIDQNLTGDRAAFKKEWANRITEFIVYNELGQEEGVKMAQRAVRQLVLNMKYFYDVSLQFTPEAIEKLMGYFNREEGGRSMRRAFTELFRMPAAELVFDHKVAPGDVLAVGVGDKGLDFVPVSAEKLASVEGPAPSTIDGLAAFKDKIFNLGKTGPAAANLKARSATAELVGKIFDPQMKVGNDQVKVMIGQDTFEKIRPLRLKR